MNFQLAGKNILVTGSSKGIGLAIIKSFLEEDANVILTGRDKKTLVTTVQQLVRKFSKEQVSFFQADLQNTIKIQKLADFINSRNIVLDHLICNIGSGKSVPVLEEDEFEWQRMLDINLMSAVNCVQCLLPYLKKNASQGKNTSITFISSICANEVLGCPVAYSAAKNALISYSKNIARPLGKLGIRVNVVSPSYCQELCMEKLGGDPFFFNSIDKVYSPDYFC